MSPTPQATFSELLQKPKDTVARLEANPRHALRLTRRGDEDLYLTTVSQARAATEVVESTSRMFVALMKSGPEVVDLLTGIFPEAFPWVRFLPEEDVREFLVELVDVTRAASDINAVAPIAQCISEWRNTAELWADPETAAALLAESTDEDFGPVPNPGEVVEE